MNFFVKELCFKTCFMDLQTFDKDLIKIKIKVSN